MPYIVTTISLQHLGELIRNKKVSLNNGDLMFGYDIDAINRYFKARIGNDGYVLGIRGRLNRTTAELFKHLDEDVLAQDGKVLLEAEVDPDDVLRYRVNGIMDTALAVSYGFSEEDVFSQLDEAQLPSEDEAAVEVLCIPFIKANGKIRITSFTEDDIEIPVSGIEFVKMK